MQSRESNVWRAADECSCWSLAKLNFAVLTIVHGFHGMVCAKLVGMDCIQDERSVEVVLPCAKQVEPVAAAAVERRTRGG